MIPLKDDNPSGTFPFVTVGLIAANMAVFAYMLMLDAAAIEGFFGAYALVPAHVFGEDAIGIPGMLVPPFSSMFMHGGLLHIGGNMLYLWIFGDNVEDSLGHVKFLAFYMLCGLAAAAAHGIMNPGSTAPMVGASGAVAGVLSAYMVLYPRARVLTFFFFVFFWQFVRVPAVLVIGAWIVIQMASGLSEVGGPGSGVAWFAHIGGFIAGLALLKLLGGRPGRSRVAV